MSMLAEPRKRKKYINVSRGKPLYDDDSRYGTKMLEKMGWSKGRGLGASENGALDFIRIRYKNDQEGMDYKARDDQWTAHETQFSELLSELHGENKKENISEDEEIMTTHNGFNTSNSKDKIEKEIYKKKISGESLEEKSKNSRARVHYKKFTKGKDLAQYSEKDLANIFGKKVIEEHQNGILHTFKAIDNVREDVEQQSGSDFVSSSLSITDYFKQKMNALKLKNEQQNNSLSNKENNDAATELDHRNGDVEEQSNIDLPSSFLDEEKQKKIKKKKSKQDRLKEYETEEPNQQALSCSNKKGENMDINLGIESSKTKRDRKINDENESTNINLVIPLPDSIDEPSRKKIKKNKRKEEDEIELIKPEQDLTLDNECEVTIVENVKVIQNCKSEKKKRKKDEENLVQTLDVTNNFPHINENEEKLNMEIVKNSKKSKKNDKLVAGKEHEGADNSQEISKKKKKRKTEIIGEEIEDNFNNEHDAEGNSEEISIKKKKQKTETNEEEIREDLNDKRSDADGCKEISKKKKKRKTETIGVEIEDNFNNEHDGESNSEEISSKKKKSKTETNAEEIRENLYDERSDADDSEAISKKKKKRKTETIDKEIQESLVEGREVVISNQESNTNEVNAEKNNLSVDDLLAICNIENYYVISAFAAEKFRYAAMEAFIGSSLPHIIGYSLNENIKLDITSTIKDEERINKLWESKLNKYNEEKYSFQKYNREVWKARRAKEQIPHFHVKKWKRRNAFQTMNTF